MSLIPSEDSERKDDRRERLDGLNLAIVEKVNPDADHMVKVKVVSSYTQGTPLGSPTAIPALVSTRGDVALPSEDDLVVVAKLQSNLAVLLGVVYTRQDDVPTEEDPTYKAGLRRIAHPTTGSNIRIEESGNVVIEADSGDKITVDTENGEVSINDGTNPVAYDVNTTTDSDGHVTDVSLVTSNKLKVP